MVMDSFEYEQRKLLSELSDKEIVITEVRDLENSHDVEIRVNFKNGYDKREFMDDFESFVKNCFGGI
jgi:hypothetical protein